MNDEAWYKMKNRISLKQSDVGDEGKTSFKMESLSYFVLNKIKRND